MRISRHKIVVAAVAAGCGGCADLALEPDSIPHSMVLLPADTLITEGDPLRLRVTVLDVDGNVIPGPPSWAPPAWEVEDADAVQIAPDGTVTGLAGTSTRVIAKSAGLEAWTTLRINPLSVALSAPVVYLNQAAQNVDGTVPIIAGRRAFLRVFANGDAVSFYEPRLRATFYRDGAAVHSVLINPPSELLPDRVVESRLDRSYNAVIPGEVLKPGVGLVVEIDPDGVVPQSAASQSRIPPQGVMPLDIVDMPNLHQVIVPVLVTWSPDERVFNWTRGMTAESPQLQLARTLLPIGDMTVEVHETYYTSADLTEGAGWNAFIREIRTLYFMEGEKGYYYGALQLPAGSAWGGLGYLNLPVSVGRAREDTYAHELGHNMSLRHAPCGSAGGPDPNYPYDDGSSGIWGYHIQRGRLIDPEQYRDLMGYCTPDWVSDYHFIRATNYRMTRDTRTVAAAADAPAPGDVAAPPEKTLLLWGGVGDGEFVLEPAFLIDAPAKLPEAAGPYRLQGFGPGGESRFAFAFSPDPVEHGGAHFFFTVPHDPDRDGAIERVVLTGPEGEHTLRAGSTPPMAIITNRATGQVRAILRDWDGRLNRLDGDTEIMVSDGLPGGVR
ncbi:MAG: M66 family metalloprotease [Gemmatimonadetes bacterium]|nr:M66 family metalloprotease [Gemmatimonadota bacterium]